MKNMERVLEEIKIADVEPSEELVRVTKLESKRAMRAGKKAEIINSTKRSKLTVRVLSAATVVAFVFVALVVVSIRSQNPIDGAAYYTIDINPSFGFTVDEENVVIDVDFQNDDAKELYDGLDCIGMSLQDAIILIIQKAAANGYINEEGDTYVLLGQFMDGQSDKEREEILNQLLASLQNEVGVGIKLIGVNGDTKDLEYAKELDISPGILILCKLADEDPDGKKRVEDIVKNLPDELNGEPEFAAPVIKGSAEGNMLIIEWGKIDFSKVDDEEAQIEYKLLKGSTLDEIKNMENVVRTHKSSIDDAQLTEFWVSLAEEDLNTKTYYCLYVHCGNTSKLSNVLPIGVQDVKPTKEPEVTPEPIGEDGSSTITGSIAGDKITLNWTAVDSERFSGYKVMYSSIDSTPVYGEDGCYYLEYVTDAGDTSGIYKLSSLNGYVQGKKYYFSITVLYDEQETKVSGNVITKIMPTSTTTTATPPPTSGEYPSSNISGYRDGDKIYLNWGKISDSRLEGYKVVYSFSDSTPVYDSSSYLRWITNASTTSTVIDISELKPLSADDRPCYFSITALYENHSVKKAGNTITIVIPPNAVSYDHPTPIGFGASYNGDTGIITINWDSVESDHLTYYKANYSFTNSSPAYGATGTTSIPTSELANSHLAESLDGYGPGETCYVSVTAVYNDGEKRTSVVKTIIIPEETTTPDYPAANVTSASDYLVEWSTVSHEDFVKYKVMYSFTDGSGSGVIEEISSASSGIADYNKELQLPGYAGKTCNFYIVTIYWDGTDDYAVTGSSKSVTFPEETTP